MVVAARCRHIIEPTHAPRPVRARGTHSAYGAGRNFPHRLRAFHTTRPAASGHIVDSMAAHLHLAYPPEDRSHKASPITVVLTGK
jgi:hypothetical protein